MTKNLLAIIGGSGLYEIEELSDVKYLNIETPWGSPSDKIIKAKYQTKDVIFLFSYSDSVIAVTA